MAARVQERMFLRGVAELIDHGLGDHARAEEETGALDGVDLAAALLTS